MFGSASTRRRVAAAAVAASLSVGGMAVLAPASAAPAQSGPPAQVLDRDMRGEAAINALGSRLPAVAAQNDMTAAEFRAALREDSMLWVSRSGQLLFVDEFVAEATSTLPDPAFDSTSIPTASEIFTLHSRPGSNRVIVLDFNGHDYKGTAWYKRDSSGYASPYNSEGDSATFSEAERAVIHSVWQRVAEDYAPFDVDVTTEDPGAEAIRRTDGNDQQYGTRVVVTPTQAYNCSCGGVAYVGTYDITPGSTHDYYQPAWVFTNGVGFGAKNIAEAASHEAGHNLGLSHDGTSTTGYYTGHGDWAPIMGVGYYEAISQWSKGEYAGANNTEDDYSVVAENGVSLRADDHSATTPTVIALTNGAGSARGLIERATDVDAFSITVQSPTEVVVSPALVSPNLDISVVARSASETKTANPLGLAASLSLGAGTWTLEVDGVGFGDPLNTGYSDYGSVGHYTVSIGGGTTADPGDPPTNSAPVADAVVSSKSGRTVVFSGAGSYDPDGSSLTYTWVFSDGGTATGVEVSHLFPTDGTHTATLTVSDGEKTGVDEVSVTVKATKGKPVRAR
jgi:hypothetical protein